MTVLKVKRPSAGLRVLKFQGRDLPLGAEIDTRDFPRVSAIPKKWAQLISQGYFYDIDHTADPELARDVREHRDEFGAPVPVSSMPEPVVPVDQYLTAQERAELGAQLDKPIGLECGECGFHAKSDQGLRVHIGRSHKKE